VCVCIHIAPWRACLDVPVYIASMFMCACVCVCLRVDPWYASPNIPVYIVNVFMWVCVRVRACVCEREGECTRVYVCVVCAKDMYFPSAGMSV